MDSPRPSLDSSTSIVSTSSSDGAISEEEVEVAKVPQVTQPPTTKTTVNVDTVVVQKGAQMPGVLHGDFNVNNTTNNTNINLILTRASDISDSNINDLTTDAAKINPDTFKSFLPTDFNSFSKLTGTKEDVEGLSRRWCYLIATLVALSLITLLGTAVLSLTSWRTSQGSALTPATQATVEGMSVEEEQFSGVSSGLRIITRTMWLAAPSTRPLQMNTLPVSLVVVCYTATRSCTSQPECVNLMRAMQRYHQETRRYVDLGYNFVIGGDGEVYSSRGFKFAGEHTKGFDQGSIGVAFIGNFVHVLPNQTQIEAFNKLIQVGVDEGKIAPDYTLMAQCQLKDTSSPGLALVHNMTSWPHYNSTLSYKCTAS